MKRLRAHLNSLHIPEEIERLGGARRGVTLQKGETKVNMLRVVLTLDLQIPEQNREC